MQGSGVAVAARARRDRARRGWMFVVGAIAFGVLLPLPPRPAVAYRPFETTDASVSGEWQLTLEAAPLSYLYGSQQAAIATPTLGLALGLPWGIELGIGSRVLVQLPTDAGERRALLVDNAASFKKMLYSGSLQDLRLHNVSIAAEVDVLLPSSASDEQVGFQAVLALSQVWTWLMAFHLNVGGGLSRAHDGVFYAGAAFEGPWRWPLRPIAEVSLCYDAGVGAIPSVAGGTIIPVNPNLWIDAALRWVSPPADGDDQIELTAGINWSFP